MRHGLAANLLWRVESTPTRFAKLLIGFFETGRRRYTAIFVADTAFLIPDLVEGKQHIFNKFTRLSKNCIDHFRRSIFKARQFGETLDIKHIVDDKLRIADGSLITRHYLKLSDRKSTRLNSSHVKLSYAVFCSRKKH